MLGESHKCLFLKRSWNKYRMSSLEDQFPRRELKSCKLLQVCCKNGTAAIYYTTTLALTWGVNWLPFHAGLFLYCSPKSGLIAVQSRATATENNHGELS